MARSTTLQRGFLLRTDSSNLQQQTAWEHGIAGGQHADDCFYHGPAGTVADNWDDLKEKLQEAGLELQDKKSAAFTPSIEDLNEDERKGLHRMLELVPRADHPPRVLGTMAQNQRWAMTKDFDEQDDEEADRARHAIKGAEAAKKLCEAIKELSVADVEGPSIAAGWAMLAKSAARAHTERHTHESTRNPAKHPERCDRSIGGNKLERRGTQHRLSTRTTRRMQHS